MSDSAEHEGIPADFAPQATGSDSPIAQTPVPGKRRAGWVRALLAGLAAIVVVGAIWGFVWYRDYRRSPAYSIMRLSSAVQSRDLGSVEQYVDVSAVVEQVYMERVPSLTEEEVSGGTNPDWRSPEANEEYNQAVDTAATNLGMRESKLEAGGAQFRDSILSGAKSGDGTYSVGPYLAARRVVSSSVNRDSASVKIEVSRIGGGLFDVTLGMKRAGDLWRVVSIDGMKQLPDPYGSGGELTPPVRSSFDYRGVGVALAAIAVLIGVAYIFYRAGIGRILARLRRTRRGKPSDAPTPRTQSAWPLVLVLVLVLLALPLVWLYAKKPNVKPPDQVRPSESFAAYKDHSTDIKASLLKHLPGATDVVLESVGWTTPTVGDFPGTWKGGREYAGSVYFGTGDAKLEMPFRYTDSTGDVEGVSGIVRPYGVDTPIADDEFKSFVDWFRPATGLTRLEAIADVGQALVVGDLPPALKPRSAPDSAILWLIMPARSPEEIGQVRPTPLVALDRKTSRWYLIAVDGGPALDQVPKFRGDEQ